MIKKEKSKKITIDMLAKMMKDSFETVATKTDILALRDDIKNIDQNLSKILGRE